MPDFQPLPVLFGSLTVCEGCWSAVPRWAQDRHRRVCGSGGGDDARVTRASLVAGERLVPLEQVKAESG